MALSRHIRFPFRSFRPDRRHQHSRCRHGGICLSLSRRGDRRRMRRDSALSDRAAGADQALPQATAEFAYASEMAASAG